MTTDDLITEVQANRQGEEYPDSQMLLHNLPVLLRKLCDFTLTKNSTKIEIARALAPIIDTVENVTPTGQNINITAGRNVIVRNT